MKALVIHAAQDLRIEERAPERLGPGQVRIRMAVGGVCGSDLHYYNHGGFGTVRLREPMILGHEVSGHVVEVAPGWWAWPRAIWSPYRPRAPAGGAAGA